MDTKEILRSYLGSLQNVKTPEDLEGWEYNKISMIEKMFPKSKDNKIAEFKSIKEGLSGLYDNTPEYKVRQYQKLISSFLEDYTESGQEE